MIRLAVIFFVASVLVSFGCTSSNNPSSDPPGSLDVGAPMDSDALPIDVEPQLDMGPPVDQAFIPSSRPIPTRVETTLNVEQLRAGEQAQVRCTVFDQDGEEIVDAVGQIDIRPAQGIEFEATEMGWSVVGKTAGQYNIFCTYPSAGLRDPSPRSLGVVPNIPAWIQTSLTPEVITAGGQTEIKCDIADAYGNAVEDSDLIDVMVSPSSERQTLSGRTFSTTQAGETFLTCTAGAAQTTSAVLVVQPDLAANLMMTITPNKSSYRIGEVVSVGYLVTDQYNNEILNHPVEISSNPPLTQFGPRRFRLLAEGIYSITLNIPDSEPNLSSTVEILVDDRGPTIDCTSPSFGDMLAVDDGDSIVITGAVDDISGATGISVDGQPIQYDGGPTFSTSYTPSPGLNLVELQAVDALGQSTRSLCGFFVAPSYQAPDSIAPNSIALDLRQGAVDDGDNGAEIKSFGDLVRLATRSDGLTNTIDDVLGANPRLIQNQSLGIGTLRYLDYRGGLSISSPDVAMSLDPLGLGFELGLDQLRMNIRANGCTACGCTFLGLSCEVSCTIDGSITVSGTDALSIFQPSLSNGVISFDALGTTVTVNDIDTNFGGFCGNLVDAALAVAGAFSSFLEDTVADALKDLINDTLTGVLADALGGIDFSAFAFDFELDGFDGQTSNLSLTTALTGVSANATRLQLGLGTQVSGPIRQIDDGLGIPQFGPGVLNGYDSRNTMSALLDGILLNQVMYGLWRAGFFNIDDVGGLGDGDSALEANIELLVPPAVEILESGDEFLLHFGPASGSLTYADLLTRPIGIRFGAVLRASIGLEDNGEVVFAPDGLTFESLRLDVADSGLSADLANALEAEIANIVATLLNDAVSGAFPTLPIPEFSLPASLAEFGVNPNIALGIRNPEVLLDPQSIIINGGFGQ